MEFLSSTFISLVLHSELSVL